MSRALTLLNPARNRAYRIHRWNASAYFISDTQHCFHDEGAAPHTDDKCVQCVYLKAAPRHALCIMLGGGFVITSKVSAADAPSRP
jgi:hypothetical protein